VIPTEVDEFMPPTLPLADASKRLSEIEKFGKPLAAPEVEDLPPLPRPKPNRQRRKTRPTIVEFIEDRSVFGDQFLGKSWGKWKVVLSAIYGLPLTRRHKKIFRRWTGRSQYWPPPGGWPEVVIITGVRSGKSSIAAAIADYESLYPQNLPRGGAAYTLLVAQDLRGAQRTLYGYARGPFDLSPDLRRRVVRDTTDLLALDNRVSLAVYPCRPAAVRGVTAVASICDELAFFITSDGNPTDVEMLRVLRTRVATTGGKVVILSSPYAQSGALYDLHRQHHGRDDSTTLVIQASADELNPTLPPDYLARMERDDPEAYRSEVLGEFRAGVSALFDPRNLDECVDRVCRERRPDPEGRYQYVGFLDAATGSGRDSLAVSVAHEEARGGVRVAVLDCAREWEPPFEPNAALGEAAALLKSYGVRRVTGDRFAGGSEGGFVHSALEAAGVRYDVSERDRSAIYLEALPLVNAGHAVLLNLDKLLAQLRALERRTGRQGKDSVDHRRNFHDDLANSACGALVLAAERGRRGRGWSVVGSFYRDARGATHVSGDPRPPEAVRHRYGEESFRHPHERKTESGPPEMSERKAAAWRRGG